MELARTITNADPLCARLRGQAFHCCTRTILRYLTPTWDAPDPKDMVHLNRERSKGEYGPDRAASLSRELLGVDADLHDGASVASQSYHVRGATRRVSGCLSIP